MHEFITDCLTLSGVGRASKPDKVWLDTALRGLLKGLCGHNSLHVHLLKRLLLISTVGEATQREAVAYVKSCAQAFHLMIHTCARTHIKNGSGHTDH